MRQSGAAGDVSRPRPQAAARDGDVGGRVRRQVPDRRGAGPAADRRPGAARGGLWRRRRAGLAAGCRRLPGAVAVAARADQSRPELPPGGAVVGPGARGRHLGRLGPLPRHAGVAAVARGLGRRGGAALRPAHGGSPVRDVPGRRLAAAGGHRLEQGEPGAGALAGAAPPGDRRGALPAACRATRGGVRRLRCRRQPVGRELRGRPPVRPGVLRAAQHRLGEPALGHGAGRAVPAHRQRALPRSAAADLAEHHRHRPPQQRRLQLRRDGGRRSLRPGRDRDRR